MKGKYKNRRKNKEQSTTQYKDTQSSEDKINLDYDWNTEYGDGDIPIADK